MMAMFLKSNSILRGCMRLTSYGIRYKSNVKFEVNPISGLVDESLTVKISGLEPFERTSILCTLVERKKTFAAVGHYTADGEGSVNTTSQPSWGGTYCGLEPEGLIWSMKIVGRNSLQRVQKLDVTTSFPFKLRMFRNVLTVNQALETEPVAEIDFERWYMSPTCKVTRTLVRGEKIRGSLFMPSGNGPFLPVIDMFGGIGGLTEHRAALLATKGFAVMALAHFSYDDLPEFPGQVPIDYFEEAVHLIKKCDPRINQDVGVNVVGTCLGGMYALAMAEAFPEVSAVASINGFHRPFIAPLEFKGISRSPMDFDAKLLRIKENGDIIMMDTTIPENYEDHVFKIENSNARFLIIAGDLDDSVSPTWSYEAAKRLDKREKKNHELCIYHGAGHLLEPPFSPFSNRAPVRFFRGILAYGGETHTHALAQSQAWVKLLSFLKNGSQ